MQWWLFGSLETGCSQLATLGLNGIIGRICLQLVDVGLNRIIDRSKGSAGEYQEGI